MLSQFWSFHRPLCLFLKNDEMHRQYTKPDIPKQYIHKLLLIMRLTTFLLTITIMQASAASYAQKITLSEINITLKKALVELKKQSGYDILCTEDLLEKSTPVNIKVKGVELKEVLALLFEEQPLSYIIDDNTIIVRERTKNVLEQSIAMLNQMEIHGKVTDSLGTPLVKATVRIKGTTRATFTDNAGRFTLRNVEKDAVLEISYIGFHSQEIPASSDTRNIILTAQHSALSEVEVKIGYGSARAKDLTGSVSRITAEDLEGAPPHADIAAMLQGKAAGVNVMIANGSPGALVAVQIRGTTSLTGNNQPLWVIDGIPQYDVSGSDIASTLYDFNVNDVESVDILKDASATAIYGSRAANGVILVTTKQGSRNLLPQIDVSYNVGVQVQQDQFRMLNTEEFIDVLTDAARNYFATTGTAPTTGGISLLLDNTQVATGTEIDYYSAPLKSTAFFDGTTDWWNELTQHAIESKYDISIRGGSQVSNYYLSTGIIEQQGIVKGSDRKGIMGRFNFDTKIGEGLRTGIQLNGTYTGINNKDNMIDKIWNFRPDFPMYDESGNVFDPGYNEENPLTSLQNRNLSKRRGLNVSAFLEYKPIRDLLLRSSIALRYNGTTSDRFTREGTAYTNHQGQANMSLNESTNWVFENTATYSKLFARKHSMVALAGFTAEKGVSSGFATGVQNFPDQNIMTNLSSGTTPMRPTSTHTSSAIASALTRLNYKYADKYLATFTLRADGSSRFGPNRRWGYFPSGAVAWLVSSEPFIKNNLKALSYFKLRASYGKAGSQVLGNHDWRTLYNSAQYNEQPGMAPSQLGNDELQWEQTLSLDLGLDYGLFNDRLRGTIGRYVKETRDIIYNRNIPSSSAFTSVRQNVATIENKGVEFDITYDVVKKKDITFSLGFNIAHNESKALKINGVDSVIQIYSGSALAMRIKEGEPLNQWIGYKWSGRYYQSMEEYDLLSTQNPTNGAKIWYQNGLSTIRPGDLRFEDTNGDGIVNNDDRVPLGSAQPKFFGGFSPSLRVKSFWIQTNFSFSYGAKRYWYTNSANWYSVGLFLKNYPDYVLDNWREDNRESDWPRMAFGQGSSNTFSDFWLSRADFLRLNLVRLNYRLPQTLLKIKYIGGMDLSVSATNLLTLTNYNGIDPQGNFSLSAGGIAGTGTDNGTYPAIKTYNFSAKVTIK